MHTTIPPIAIRWYNGDAPGLREVREPLLKDAPEKEKNLWRFAGTQADFSADGRWTGVIMESGKKQVTGSLGAPQKLLEVVTPNEWNEFIVLARGGQVKLSINGVPMCELNDHDPKRLVRGWLALQVHTGPPMRVQFKDIFLRRL